MGKGVAAVEADKRAVGAPVATGGGDGGIAACVAVGSGSVGKIVACEIGETTVGGAKEAQPNSKNKIVVSVS